MYLFTCSAIDGRVNFDGTYALEVVFDFQTSGRELKDRAIFEFEVFRNKVKHLLWS